jgi:hypothetical protein
MCLFSRGRSLYRIVRYFNTFLVVKQSKTTEIKRVFNKETSVFKAWLQETEKQKKESIHSDSLLWKLKNFMKKPNEVPEVSNNL